MAADGGEVVRALVVEQRLVVDGAGGEDAGDLAGDEFSGDGFGRLLGDGDAFSGLEQAGDVALRRVIRNPAHRGAAALGEGDVHDRRGGFRVVEEHFVKVAEAVKQDDVGGQRPAHGLVLGHHGGQRGLGHGRSVEGRVGRIKKRGAGKNGGQSTRYAISSMA